MITEGGRFSQYQVGSVYFGGGTPTVMRPAALDGIVRELQNSIPHASDCELAIESSPSRATPVQLKQLREIGFRRISFGVQSFVDEELAVIGRHHTAADAIQSIADAHAAGFQNVNVDLIYGLGGQTLRDWEKSLAVAVGQRPETVTVYPLTFRSRTAFGKSFKISADGFPSPAERHEQYELARNFLVAKGYRQLTMVAFAGETGGNLHEQNEFLGVPTVGFGAGALSYGPNYHYTSGHYHDSTPNAISISQYETRVRSGEPPIEAGIYLDLDEQMRRHLVMRLPSVGVTSDDFANRFGVRPEMRYGDLLRVLRDHDLVDIGANHIRLTALGVRSSSLVADILASERVRTAAASYG
jgi:oxygen-independent coproporphyrinogen-3 oxidase